MIVSPLASISTLEASISPNLTTDVLNRFVPLIVTSVEPLAEPAIGKTDETTGVSWYLYVIFVFETPPEVVTRIFFNPIAPATV